MMDHPLRAALAAELHARPFLRLAEAVSLTHYAIYADGQPDIHETLLHALCRDTGIDAPHEGATHYAVQSPCGWHLKWERHTEFSTFTFVAPRRDTGYFDDLAIDGIPAAWFARLAGIRFVAVRMELLSGDAARRVCGDLRRWIDGPVLVGSHVLGGGKVFCDWHVRDDGFMRFLVVDEDFREEQGGRLLQRLYEIETYRMMALLALPVARRMSRELDEIHAALHVLMQRMDASGADGDDAALLVKLTHLAVRVESLSGSGARFSASRAYEKLVLARIHELREERIEGMPTIAEFMERRFAPAMETCRSVMGASRTDRRADRPGGRPAAHSRESRAGKGCDAAAGRHGAHRAQPAAFAARGRRAVGGRHFVLRAVARDGGVQGAARDEPAGRSRIGGGAADRAGRVRGDPHHAAYARAACAGRGGA